MTSIDANVLLFSYHEASPHHAKAHAFVASLSQRDDVALSEFVLSEVYLHLRNPAVNTRVGASSASRPAAATSMPPSGKPLPHPVSPVAASTTSAPRSASKLSALPTSPLPT